MKNPSEMTDRELDDAVAEEVMGWELNENTDCWIGKDNDGVRRSRSSWEPSADHNAMAEVLAKMIERWPDGQLGMLTHPDNEWSVFMHDGHGIEMSASATSFPRAVCEAALLAVRAEKQAN